MKRVFLMCVMLFLLTGCSIEYNLNFVDNNLTEDIQVKLSGSDYTFDKIENLKAYKLLAVSKGLEQKEYEKSFKDLSNEFIMNYHYDFTINDFYKHNILNNCYDSFALTTEDDHYLLVTGKIFKCLSFDYQNVSDYKINIKTNHKVLDHNADDVKNGVYTWNIYNNDGQVQTEKQIMIKFSKQVKDETTSDNIIAMLIIIGGIVIVGGIVFFIGYQKNKINNKI